MNNNPIDRCLASLAMSTYTNIEIICIDEGLERSKQRNIGLRKAQGEFICYLDDDQYVSPELIHECVSMPSWVQAVYIPEIITDTSWFGKFRNWERKFYTGTPVDCVRFFRSKGCPMFDETMTGPEDADFDRQILGSKEISNNPLYHDDKATVFAYLKKKKYYAQSMEAFRKKWPDALVLKAWYRCFWIFVEKGKWKMLLRRLDYTFILFLLLFVRGLIYICRRK